MKNVEMGRGSYMIFDMSAEEMNTMHRNQTGSFMFDLSFICPLEYKLNWPAPSQNIYVKCRHVQTAKCQTWLYEGNTEANSDHTF